MGTVVKGYCSELDRLLFMLGHDEKELYMGGKKGTITLTIIPPNNRVEEKETVPQVYLPRY